MDEFKEVLVTSIGEQIAQANLNAKNKREKDSIVFTKKEAKKTLIQVISLTAIAVTASAWLTISNIENIELKQQIDRLTMIEQDMGQFNNYQLRKVVYDVGEALGDKAENCNGLIMSVDDAVFCQSVGI